MITLGSPAPRVDRVAAWVTVAAITAAAFVARWTYLQFFDWPLGIDGFYYAVQVRSLLQDHRLYYPASPMVFWLMVPAASVLGPIAGAKLTAAIGTSLGAVPVYAIVSRATRRRTAGILGAAIMATAAGAFYFTVEFVKQGVGLTLALGCVAAIGAALDTAERRTAQRWSIAAAVLGIAALLSHLTSIGIAAIFALPVVWVSIMNQESATRRRRAAMIAGAILVLMALIVLLVPATRHRMGLEHVFGPASLSFTGEFFSFHHEVALALLAALAVGVLLVGWRPPTVSPPARALLVGPVALALFLAVPWLSVSDGQGVVYRLRLMAFVPLAICAPVALAFFLERFAPRLQALVTAAAAVVIMGLVPLRYPGPALPPNQSHIAGLTAIGHNTPPDAIIVVRDRVFAFMIKWLADREARVQPPADPGHRPMYWLASPGVLSKAARGHVTTLGGPVALPFRPRQPMLLIPEATWRQLLALVPAEERAKLDPWPGR